MDNIYEKAIERAAMALFDACTGSSLFWAAVDNTSKESWRAAIQDEINNVGKPIFSVQLATLRASLENAEQLARSWEMLSENKQAEAFSLRTKISIAEADLTDLRAQLAAARAAGEGVKTPDSGKA